MPGTFVDKRKVLFLFSELSPYFLACIRELIAAFPAEAHIVRWPVNPEAPFVFPAIKGAVCYEREQYSTEGLVRLADKTRPNIVVTSGWRDWGYLTVCAQLRPRVPTVLTLDLPWRGTLKQKLNSFLGRLVGKKLFSHVWVPGRVHFEYARRLGFAEHEISAGLYSADTDLFTLPDGDSFREFQKRFLFVGRFITVKGIQELWRAFLELQTELPNSWELHCAGTGFLENQIPTQPKIKRLGFLQPAALAAELGKGGVLVLPSRFEPWGVAVHEAAAARMPLVLSDQVCAGSVFLHEGENGYRHAAADKESLKSALRKVIASPDAALFEMGRRSAELACQITPQTWSRTLWQVMEGARTSCAVSPAS
jgi:glycosyltransferase involved in cell wall biosynthesis